MNKIIIAILVSKSLFAGILGSSGEESFSFTRQFSSANSLAHSKANVAGSFGILNFRNNVALLDINESQSFYLNYGFEKEEFSNGSLGYSQNIYDAQLAVIFNVRTLNNKIDEIDDNKQYTGASHRPWAEETHWALSYSPIDGVKIGHGLHLLFSRLTNDEQDKTAWGVSTDFGLSYQKSPKSIAWGFSVNQWGRQFGGYYQEENKWLDGDINLGLRWRLPVNPRLAISHNLFLPFFGEERFIQSAEYQFHPAFSVILSTDPSVANLKEWLGFKNNDEKVLEKEWPFAGGILLKISSLNLSYSISPHETLSWHHQLSISYIFFK